MLLFFSKISFPRMGRWIAIIFILLFIILFLTGKSGFISVVKARFESNNMAKEVVKLEKDIEDLKETIAKLESDTAYIEHIAREKLGMAKKGEKVYKFKE